MILKNNVMKSLIHEIFMLIKCDIFDQWYYDQINYHFDVLYTLKGSIVTLYMLFMHYL